MATNPVFIIGAARTGTTWISNILRMNFGYFTPAHFLHFGVKEPNLFLLDRLYDSVGSMEGFLERIKESDIFRLIRPNGVDLKAFSFSSYHDLFCQLIEENARQSGREWFTKIDPDYFYGATTFDELYRYLIERYPTARFIIVKREFRDYLNSYLNMPGQNILYRQNPLFRGLAGILASARYRNLYRYAEGKVVDRNLIVNYEDLTRDFSESLAKLGEFLGKRPINNNTIDVRNSSECSGRKRISRFASTLLYLSAGSTVINTLALRIFERFFHRNEYKIYRRIEMLENDPSKLIAVLQEEGHYNLVEEVKKYLNG